MTMLEVSLTERVASLSAEGTPFVHATVVRAQPPTPARPGDEALILADGTMEGFVGGQCAEESVRAAALDVLAEGEPLLLRILPDGDPGYPPAFGSRSVVNPCLSGGALEIFLEPRLPPRRVVVVGETPLADAVASLLRQLGFRTDQAPVLAAGAAAGATALVVASCGHDEPEAIRAALDAGVGFVGLVASRHRGEVVVDAMDLTAEERSRVRTPVGIPIGARTASEVAVSIAAELVRAVRIEGLRAPGGDAAPGAPAQAVDPVCGMNVVVGPHTPHRVVGGVDVWFCSTGCRDRHAA
jgi:xanthine dehydrogenase accessory factor